MAENDALPAFLATDDELPPKHCSFLYGGAHWELELIGSERWLLSRRGTRICMLKPIAGAWKGCSFDESVIATRLERDWTGVVAGCLAEARAPAVGPTGRVRPR